MKNKIVIIISGGAVMDISGIPENVEVEIHDYDVEQTDWDGRGIEVDETGDRFQKMTFQRD